MFKCGYFCLDGIGIDQNLNKSMEYFKNGADNGDVQSMHAYAIF